MSMLYTHVKQTSQRIFTTSTVSAWTLKINVTNSVPDLGLGNVKVLYHIETETKLYMVLDIGYRYSLMCYIWCFFPLILKAALQ